jgi:hypothetical protein
MKRIRTSDKARAVPPLPDGRIDLVRQCTQPWSDQDVTRLRASLSPTLLRSMMLSYVNKHHDENAIHKLTTTLATALPNSLIINHVGKLQTVSTSSF